MSDLHQAFLSFLEKNDQRYSDQKREIVDAIIHEDAHFEVDELISKFFLKGHRFSRATVYRTIKQLLDANLIQKITTQDGTVYYEHNSDLEQHDHIICNKCGRIFEIKDKTIESKINKECEKLGFFQEYRSIHIYGVCKTCQELTAD